MSLYAIGDIHGSFNSLKTLFENHYFQKTDTIVFLGDYIDKGPDSKKVINWLIENSKNYRFVFLKGNHELMMLSARFGGSRLKKWLLNGGIQTLHSYDVKSNSKWIQSVPKDHWRFIESGKPYYETEGFIFVHAGLEPGLELEEQSKRSLFWKKFTKPKYAHHKTVICGHTARKNGEIANFGHTLCIDTYAHGGKWLSCLNVETNTFIQANEKEEIRKGSIEEKNNYIGSKLEELNFHVSRKLILPSMKSLSYLKNHIIAKNIKTASRLMNF